MPNLATSRGLQFLTDTSLDREELARGGRPEIGRAEPFKTYPGAECLPLPTTWAEGGKDLWHTLQERRSRRSFGPTGADLATISRLLWASQGITGQAGRYFFRTAPSGGALYPIETYLAVNHSAEIAPGLYHFKVGEFALERLRCGSLGPALAAAAVKQKMLAEAALVFIWTAIPRRSMSKYGERGMRYLLLDAGHICQNLLLAAESLNFAACPVAAFFDAEMNGLLDLDGVEESVLYLAAVGQGNAAERGLPP
ncbi:MAG: SagB/ThcOx family dehydrogenase [Desulfobulbaceae bacterium]|nr:SagB/ThcOx family dehydrogenase [Desulfobulbaceae bacterium]